MKKLRDFWFKWIFRIISRLYSGDVHYVGGAQNLPAPLTKEAEEEILSEIDEAIKRIKNGTYGICEITGKPIPESRLLSIPYTRCTLEGQQIKEAEIKRQKASQRASLYDMTDGTSQSVPSDEDPISE